MASFTLGARSRSLGTVTSLNALQVAPVVVLLVERRFEHGQLKRSGGGGIWVK